MSPLTTTLRDASLFHPEAYPVIRHLDDIAPHIAQNRGIRTFRNGPLVNVRYLINDPEVFKTAYDLECRGLIFDSMTGLLLSRPFHKFFNLSKREILDEMLAAGPVDLFDKLDGSMLGGLVLNGQVRLHTKGGFTDQSIAAEADMPEGVAALVREAFDAGHTPIFEWVGPDNRIVLAYEQPEFVLLAVRHRESGAYDEAFANALSERHGVRRPTVLARVSTPEELWDWMARIATMTGVEGVVAVGPDGRRGKIKTRAYLSVHRALTMLSTERHAFRAVVEEIDDDLIPLLPPGQAAFFQDYARLLRARVLDVGQEAETQAKAYEGLTGGELAARVRTDIPATHQPLVFSALKDKPAADVLLGILRKRTGSQVMVDEAKSTYGLPDWAPPAGLFLQD